MAIDGGVPKTHDIFRQQPGCFMQASEGIRNCTETGLFDDVGVTMSLTGKNWSEVAIAYEHARRLHATSFHVSALLPLGRGAGLRMPVSQPQKVEVMRFLLSQLPKAIDGQGPLPLAKHMPYFTRFAADAGTDVPDPLHYFALRSLGKGDHRFNVSALRAAQGFMAVFSACGWGITSMALSPEGQLLPCTASPVRLGPIAAGSGSRGGLVNDGGLQSVWAKDRVLNLLRDRTSLKGKCGACVDRDACGGSRIQAFASSYDWLEADPGCPY